MSIRSTIRQSALALAGGALAAAVALTVPLPWQQDAEGPPPVTVVAEPTAGTGWGVGRCSPDEWGDVSRSITICVHRDRVHRSADGAGADDPVLRQPVS